MITIILAGGQSSRMGENKALLKINGERVIDKLIKEFTPISEKVIVIVDHLAHYEDLSVDLMMDDLHYKGQGPLAGLWTAFSRIKAGTCLVVACDMPFASRELGTLLVEKLNETKLDVVVPSVDGQIHPLFAAYDAKIFEQVKASLDEGKRSVQSLIKRLKVEFIQIETNQDVVWNMNTPEEYIKAVKMAGRNDLR